MWKPSFRPLALAGALFVTGCSVLLSTEEAAQCTVDADCEAQPLMRGRICQSGICVKRAAVPVSAEAGAGCESTALCTQQNSNQPSVCPKRGEACVPWVNETCRKMTGTWDQNSIIVGFIAPFSVKQVNGALPQTDYAKRSSIALELARSQIFDDKATTIKDRPVAVLSCDSQLDPTTARAAFDHLVDVVGVSAMIVAWDDDLLAIKDKANQKKVAIACADCLSKIPDGVQALPMLPPVSTEAPLVAARVKTLEQQIRDQNGNKDIKVAFLYEDATNPNSFRRALLDVLTVNNVPAPSSASFREFRAQNPRVEAVTQSAIGDALAAFEPDIVIAALGEDLVTFYIPAVEAAGKKPFYVTTNMTNELTLFKRVVTADKDDLRKRISGTRPYAYAQEQVAKFNTAYRGVVLDPRLLDADYSFGSYDAFYALTYALAVASRTAAFDGVEISRGFESLSGPGTSVFVGPDELGAAMYTLGSGSKISLKGLWAPLEWDFNKRELKNPKVGMYCLERDGNGALVLNPNAGPTYEPNGGGITGTYSCK